MKLSESQISGKDGEENSGLKSYMSHNLDKEKYRAKSAMFGDFVPCKVGKRMIDTIKFTVKINCLASDMELDQ